MAGDEYFTFSLQFLSPQKLFASYFTVRISRAAADSIHEERSSKGSRDGSQSFTTIRESQVQTFRDFMQYALFLEAANCERDSDISFG